MTLFSWLTTSEKAVDTGLDLVKSAASGIDLLFHTDEEKSLEAAQARTALFAHAIEMNKLFNASSTESSMARRTLAMIITAFVLAIAVYCILVLTYGYFTPAHLDASQRLTADIVTILGKLWIGEAFAAVVTTFFISHGVYKAAGR